MFGPLNALFKSREAGVRIFDKVWMSAQAKFKACAAMAATNPDIVFVCWFEETHRILKGFLNEENLLRADHALSSSLTKKMIVFAEHHPLSKKELALFKSLNLKEAPILSSIDEPLLMWFGGERTLELMKKLSMDENEVIGSGLITKAIHNAQQKIEKQVKVEREAYSQQEWLTFNFPK